MTINDNNHEGAAQTRQPVTPWPDVREIGVDDLEFIGRRTFVKRIWRAQIEINGKAYDTPLSEYDLMRSQISDAALDAAGLMRETRTDAATIYVYKATKTHGVKIYTRRYVYLRDGKIRIQ